MGPVLRYAAAALLLVPGSALSAQSDASMLRWVRGRVALLAYGPAKKSS